MKQMQAIMKKINDVAFDFDFRPCRFLENVQFDMVDIDDHQGEGHESYWSVGDNDQ